jgi:hypothetical protein
VLQLLLQLSPPLPAPGLSSCSLRILDASDECLALLPVAISRSQLMCVRSTAFSVIGHIVLCCLRLPDSGSSSPLLPDGKGVSLISLAQDVLDLDIGAHPPAPNAPTAASQHRAHAESNALPAMRQRALPRQQRRAKSPTAPVAQEFSPELSLRSQLKAASPPRRFSPTFLAVDTQQPLLVVEDDRGSAQRSPAGGNEAGAGAVYVQEQDEAASTRPPLRRSVHNFLIPVYSSDDD